MTLVLDPTKPICDGILFDDVFEAPSHLIAYLIGREMLWATEFLAAEQVFAGRIVARDLKQAEDVAFGRGLGEKVVGKIAVVGAK